MGERFESFDNMPTAEVFSNAKLDEDVFFNLSQTPEGLSHIESNQELLEFAQERDNKEDIFYIFKFISSAETFEEITQGGSDFFPNLSEENYVEVLKYAKLMQTIFIIPPIFHKIGNLKEDSDNAFIAYINYDPQKLNKQGLYMAFKNVENEKRIFDELLKNTETSTTDYPLELRSYGDLNITTVSKHKIKGSFSGKADKKNDEGVWRYNPGILKNFKQNLEFAFEGYFPGKEVEVEI